MHVNLGSRILDLDQPRVMGVINMTPDSFSDGGRFASIDPALHSAMQMVEAGASIIDVGGESTRPGSNAISAQEQLDRIMPVVAAIRRNSDTIISIDTSDPSVMREATSAGAEMINDIFALTQSGAMDVVAETNAAVCLMHMQGVPATMQDDPAYGELPGEVIQFLRQRIQTCEEAGIQADRLIVDPGFGFGKNDDHNLALLASLRQLVDLGLPVLVGLSRKGTLGRLVGRSANERLPASLAAAVIAVERGAHIVRTHDVQATVDALKIVQAVAQAAQS